MKQKIGTKLTIYITLVVILTFSISLGVSQFFLPKFYLYQLNKKVSEAFETYQVLEDVELVERQFDVTIIAVPLEDSLNDLNENLRLQLARKHIALNKFWVSEEVLQTISEDKVVGKLYDQGKQKSSFIVHYAKEEDQLVMIGATMARFTDIASFINRFNLAFLIVSILIIIIVTGLLSRKITNPLNELQQVAKEIGELNFQQTTIQTGDEIEELAKSINKMSLTLESAQQLLTQRNLDLKQFMMGLTHELKTPLALINVYSSGIEDGLDDGTYLTVIHQQVDRMEKIITDMLYYARTEENAMNVSHFDFFQLLQEIIQSYQPLKGDKQIVLQSDVTTFMLNSEQEKVYYIVENLVSNALKYTSGNEIMITFHSGILKVSNHTTLQDISKIWQPFYVGESSRNKHFSGTGLGLATVKSLAEQLDFVTESALSNGKITFTIDFTSE
ncbi:HAMP domain-containing histidine kinase [Lysinibacillus sphaericus]|uniref:histidine kinase n=2 Tax=Lysinibacillus TaxID=400634 RepID=W7S2I8_LYSSH|nr:MULTISPECIES: HAMP domain-containing sensor histidine kinase [Lysinibacillus]MBE5083400.1 HAMP domain-containing histidine kinase [Bacillus thuringiensis]AMO33569.1 histidine kinase [Lysinibacillus sphaericus]AMR91324.1 histidine kinase [Lysinibacillus sphaericus]ANA45372.1 histidine kinase [Lysinibacillus sphaericus]EWH32421.1 histidine kinase [Lysinibacillus sphaericus CBAM5]